MFSKKTVRDINVKGKTVLVRVDYNVPIDKSGEISDDFRIKKSLPTLEYLLSKGCKIVLCSHLGRPDGKRDMTYSLSPVATHLSKLLKHKVFFVPDSIGAHVKKTVTALKPGQILLLENLRFYPGEEDNNKEFAAQLAELADVFVQDGFGVVHRAHASTYSVAKLLPSASGLLLEKEVTTLNNLMKNPKRPLMAIIGGAKIADKIEILQAFIGIADIVAVGGAMANTFLQAKGIDIGKSLHDPDDVPLARQIMQQVQKEAKKRRFVFYLPQDSVVATEINKTAHTRIVDWDAHVISSVENYPKLPPKASSHVSENEMILDIGPYSGAFIAGCIQMVDTVVWNGAMGVTETSSMHGPIGPFAHGTETIVEALLGEFGHRPYSVVGGGDTAAYLESRHLSDSFNHVSTGGGASLDLLAGKKLPGVEVLPEKKSRK